MLFEIHVSHISRLLILHVGLSSVSLRVKSIAWHRVLTLPKLIRVSSSLVVLHCHRVKLLVWHTLHVLVHSVIRLLLVILHLCWHCTHVSHSLILLWWVSSCSSILPIDRLLLLLLLLLRIHCL